MKKIFSFFTVIITSVILNTMSIFNSYKNNSVNKDDFSTQLPYSRNGRYYFSNTRLYVSKFYHSLSVRYDGAYTYPIEVFHVFEWEIGTYMPQLSKRIIVDGEDTLFSQINWNSDLITNSRTLKHLYDNVYLGNIINPGCVDDISSARYFTKQNLIKKKGLTSQDKDTSSTFKHNSYLDARLSTGFTWYRSRSNGKYYLQFITYFYGIYTGRDVRLSLTIHVGRSFQLV